MIWLDTLQTIFAALLVFVVPGIALLFTRTEKSNPIGLAARIILLSLSILTLTGIGVAALHLNILVTWVVVGVAIAIILFRKNYIAWLRRSWQLGFIAIIAAVLLVLFSLPFLFFHQGLPTGDSQKAMIWAWDIIDNNHLPIYSIATPLYNRDPVDFYTPGLHVITALVMASGTDVYLAVGFFSIALALGILLIGAAITYELANRNRLLAVVTAMWLIATNIRWLRYVREPGYHLQNAAGELLLLGLIYLLICLLRKWQWRDAITSILVGAALVTVHQFSAFIAVPMVAGIILVTVFNFRHALLKPKARFYTGIVSGGVLLVGCGIATALNLWHKLPDLFTSKPHLVNFVPAVTDYAPLMGVSWMALVLVALLFFVWQIVRQKTKVQSTAFIVSTIFLLALSQGPLFYVDIPATRALFYAVVPLSVLAALFLVQIKLHRTQQVIIAILVLVFGCNSLYIAFSTLSHSVRTNSTLTTGLLDLVTTVRNDTGHFVDAVLFDNYNRQATSWFITADRRAYSRLASDLQRPMQEATQSPLRMNIYLRQLDFEKIFSSGSNSLALQLMTKQRIRYIAAADGTSSDRFAANHGLEVAGHEDGVTLYRLKEDAKTYLPLSEANNIDWFMRSSTVAVTFGSSQDTFEHEPISLRATRLSDVVVTDTGTSRISSAPQIGLQVNVGDYLATLWQQNHLNIPDNDLELWVDYDAAGNDISVITPSGTRIPLQPTTFVRLPAKDASIDSNGFLQVVLDNPKNIPITLRGAAVGLARIP